MIKFKTDIIESFLNQLAIDHYYIATVLAIWATLLLFAVLIYLMRQSKNLKQLERQNKHRMNLLRRIINAGHVYVLIADKHGEVIDIHPDIQSLLGLQSSQVLGKDIRIFLEDTSIEQAGTFWKTIHDNKEPYNLTLGGIWRDGQEFHVNAQVRPIVLDDQVVGFVVMRLGAEETEEIQLSSRTNAELERAQAKEEAIVESIGEGVIVTDENDSVIMANKAAREIIGTDDDFTGKSINDVLSLEDENNAMLLPQHHPLREALQNNRRVMTRSYHIVRDDFSKVSLAITASPVVVDGDMVGGVLVFRDITREKDVDRAKTEFVSLASHQLRTPLTTISWYTELMSGTG
ncbi:PAS domain S-box protein, partial [candidate division WWE3 bacterium]|nr:PAS domain S-box protein [candidate division WWE3 bacterium]